MDQSTGKNKTESLMKASTSNYKCNKCKDTTWIINEEGKVTGRCECYKRDLLERVWNNFGVKPEDRKKIKDYTTENTLTKAAKKKAIDYVVNFKDLGENNCFGLLGQSGAGKSHLSIAMGVALIERGYKVIYMPYIEAMKELKANVLDDEYYINLQNRYLKVEVLIIDDLFKDKFKKNALVKELTEADMKHFYPILNYRYINHLPTIFSTECDVDMLLDLDEALAGRIIESCGTNITVFKGREYNYRLRNLQNLQNIKSKIWI